MFCAFWCSALLSKSSLMYEKEKPKLWEWRPPEQYSKETSSVRRKKALIPSALSRTVTKKRQRFNLMKQPTMYLRNLTEIRARRQRMMLSTTVCFLGSCQSIFNFSICSVGPRRFRLLQLLGWQIGCEWEHFGYAWCNCRDNYRIGCHVDRTLRRGRDYSSLTGFHISRHVASLWYLVPGWTTYTHCYVHLIDTKRSKSVDRLYLSSRTCPPPDSIRFFNNRINQLGQMFRQETLHFSCWF